MLLTIHNLPLGTKYKDLRELLLKKCDLKDLIFDGLVDDGSCMKVTVGVAEEVDAAILVRKVNGLYYNGQQLYVEDVRHTKDSESQPYCPSKLAILKATNKNLAKLNSAPETSKTPNFSSPPPNTQNIQQGTGQQCGNNQGMDQSILNHGVNQPNNSSETNQPNTYANNQAVTSAQYGANQHNSNYQNRSDTSNNNMQYGNQPYSFACYDPNQFYSNMQHGYQTNQFQNNQPNQNNQFAYNKSNYNNQYGNNNQYQNNQSSQNNNFHNNQSNQNNQFAYNKYNYQYGNNKFNNKNNFKYNNPNRNTKYWMNKPNHISQYGPNTSNNIPNQTNVPTRATTPVDGTLNSYSNNATNPVTVFTNTNMPSENNALNTNIPSGSNAPYTNMPDDNNFLNVFAQLGTNPLNAIAQFGANPLNAIAQSGANPLNVIAQPGANPLNTISQPGAYPLNTIAQPRANQLNTIAQPGANPLNTIAQPGVNLLNAIAQSGANPFNAIAQIGANPLNAIAQIGAYPLNEIATQNSNANINVDATQLATLMQMMSQGVTDPNILQAITIGMMCAVQNNLNPLLALGLQNMNQPATAVPPPCNQASSWANTNQNQQHNKNIWQSDNRKPTFQPKFDKQQKNNQPFCNKNHNSPFGPFQNLSRSQKRKLNELNEAFPKKQRFEVTPQKVWSNEKRLIQNVISRGIRIIFDEIIGKIESSGDPRPQIHIVKMLIMVLKSRVTKLVNNTYLLDEEILERYRTCFSLEDDYNLCKSYKEQCDNGKAQWPCLEDTYSFQTPEISKELAESRETLRALSKEAAIRTLTTPRPIPDQENFLPRLPKEQEMALLHEWESKEPYPLPDVMMKCLVEELQSCLDIMRNEVKHTEDMLAKYFKKRVDLDALIDSSQKLLLQHLSKRLSKPNVPVALRLFGCPKQTKRYLLEDYLRPFGCKAIVEVKTKIPIAIFDTFEEADKIVYQQWVRLTDPDLYMSTFNGVVDTQYLMHGHSSKINGGNNYLCKNKEYLLGIIEESYVNILDKDWPLKKPGDNEPAATDSQHILQNSDDINLLYKNLTQTEADNLEDNNIVHCESDKIVEKLHDDKSEGSQISSQSAKLESDKESQRDEDASDKFEKSDSIDHHKGKGEEIQKDFENCDSGENYKGNEKKEGDEIYEGKGNVFKVDKTFEGMGNVCNEGEGDETYEGEADKACEREVDETYEGEADQTYEGEADETYEGEADETYEGETGETYEGEADETYECQADETYEGEADGTYKGEVDETYEGEADETYEGEADETYEGEADETYEGEADETYEGEVDETCEGEEAFEGEDFGGNKESIEMDISESKDIGEDNDDDDEPIETAQVNMDDIDLDNIDEDDLEDY